MEKKNKLEKKFLIVANKEIKILNLEFNEIKKKNNFITFDKLLATIILKSNLKTNDKEVVFFLNKLEEGLIKKFDLVFDNLAISFGLSNTLNNLYLCPFLTKEAATNFESLNLSSNADLFNEKLIKNFNGEINYLLANDFYIEILKNLIIKKNADLELFYDEKSILGW
ncbi:Hypothetical protein MAU_5450 [Metamycoplasma auris 15026]|uniref:Uncharacterized protein n=1 Tax=Metamycoplasma auris 15026 TaxID=1188233 RepID=N9TRF8_9BACT|nr:DUF2714 domain-containing protein [Metamycoplasma auris]ENY68744.1 Hypothetical protein MAU_5450 [Metamycoplasma auris 15026]